MPAQALKGFAAKAAPTECAAVGWVERSDTHQPERPNGMPLNYMGIAGSTHPTNNRAYASRVPTQ